MIKILQDKVALNLNQVTHLLKTDDNFIVYFISGKPLHIPTEDAEKLLRCKYDESTEVFFHFSKNVYINTGQINYVKNNFENTKATKYKVTVAMPNGLEFFRAFELNDLATAKELFSFLSQHY